MPFSDQLKKLGDAVEDFLNHAFHAVVALFQPLLKKAAHDLGDALPLIADAALQAALGAAAGGSAEDAYQAAKKAAVDKARELGKSETLSLRTVAVNAATQATDAA